jgi:hypothetical protein
MLSSEYLDSELSKRTEAMGRMKDVVKAPTPPDDDDGDDGER